MCERGRFALDRGWFTHPAFRDEQFTDAEVVALSGLSRSFVHEEIKQGQLKIKKAGRRSLVLHEDAEKGLKSLPELYACKPRV